MLTFEWDIHKAIQNRKKHKVSFEEASTIFGDVLSITKEDPLHSGDEERMIQIGTTNRNRMLVVVFTERDDKIRIISARKATTKERKYYESHGQ
ncbi:MAG: BrnT family toxin [Thermodesulfobacteriota bacterium]